jgi:vancomycin aglycone glucosyltransferase
MHVLLSTFGSRGDVEPLAGLAVRLRELGAQALVCAPPDEEFAELLARVGVPYMPIGWSVREVVTATPKAPRDIPRIAAEMIIEHFDKVVAVAEGYDVVVATGLFPNSAAMRSVADKLGIRYVHVSLQPGGVPSPHHRPFEFPGQPYPPEVTDNQALWDLNVQSMNALFGAAFNTHRATIGLPQVENVRDYVLTDQPWLATDPTLSPWRQAELDVVQTGAWILPDERPLSVDLEAFLDAGAPPVFVGFGSMPMRGSEDAAEVAIAAVRAHGHRVIVRRGWAGLALIDDQDDCFIVDEVNQQALFGRVAAVVHHGGAGTTMAAAQAGVPQVVVPQIVDQPYWAGRVADLGVGVAHDGPTLTVEALSAALKTALAPETRARARAVASMIRIDGTTVAAKLLIDGI